MAKGQARSNKEVKKPKKEKAPKVPAGMSSGTSASTGGGKKK